MDMYKLFPPNTGLCKGCRNVRLVGNPRGSAFVLCKAHKINEDLPKYPTLPVRECQEYQPKPKDE